MEQPKPKSIPDNSTDHTRKLSKSERALLNQMGRLCRAVDREFASDSCPFDMETAREIERYRASADHARWSYPVDCSFIAVEPRHRLESMFSGPLFISEKHPWPTNKKGIPFEPICQIDLASLSKLGDLFLGDGLLQLWIDEHDLFKPLLRLVPEREVNLQELVAVPSMIMNHKWTYPRALRLADARSEWTHGFVVSAVHKPVLTIPGSLCNLDDTPPKTRPRLLKAFHAMDDAIRANEVNTDCPGEIGYFGNFDLIQYDCVDCPDTLITMKEYEGIFWWGEAGQAQIFYAPNKDGGLNFTFDFCC